MPRSHSPGYRAVIVGQPFIFLAALVLERFTTHPAPAEEMLRPLAVGWLVAGLLLVILSVFLRSVEWAALVTSIALLLFLGYAAPGGFVLALALWWLLVAWLRRATGRPGLPVRNPRIPIQAAFICAAVLLGIAAGASVSAPAVRAELPTLPSPSTRGGPDIFFILLDGYPRSDTLSEEFGVDNFGFEDRLDDGGFTVQPEALANYNKTWLTVASLFSSSYVTEHLDLSEPPGTLGQQARRLHQLINEGPVLDYLRQRGYDIVSIPSPISTTDVTAGADIHSSGWLSSLESTLLIHSAIGRVFPTWMNRTLASELRERVTSQFAILESLALRDDSPRFVYLHVLSPHPPFILGQEPDYLAECFPNCSLWSTTIEETGLSKQEYGTRLGVQIMGLNERVLAAADTIRAANPKAVVLILSDHGARYDHRNLDEHFETFIAARTPDHPDAFDGDVSLVNVFRRVFSAYFNEDLPDLEYAAWVSDWLHPLVIRPHR